MIYLSMVYFIGEYAMNKRLRKKTNKRQIIKRIRCVKAPADSVMFIIIDTTKCNPVTAKKIADILKNYTSKRNIQAVVIPDCIKDVQVK
jgi:hypothetical protein